MNESLMTIVCKAKDNEDYMVKLIKMFEPKIKKSLLQTNNQEREDLFQELVLKLMNCVQNSRATEVPGFLDFLNKLDCKNK
ncbi:helix-turn-helix domain-containing protein [Priestia aryabhattai]|uniref:helix-turn-helix domain-containing protein n=1 Tax=Priestia aryabhattai TaxID=412384 RepID=UPI002E24D0FB|nr:helix-turn-helix domain-containing protein [Priestia aryabhattai]